MLAMTAARKQEACDKLKGFEVQVGAGIAEIKKCGGDFPEAFKAAKAFCGTGGAEGSTAQPGPGSVAGHLCNIAKAQVRSCVYSRLMCLCVCHNRCSARCGETVRRGWVRDASCY